MHGRRLIVKIQRVPRRPTKNTNLENPGSRTGAQLFAMLVLRVFRTDSGASEPAKMWFKYGRNCENLIFQIADIFAIEGFMFNRSSF